MGRAASEPSTTEGQKKGRKEAINGWSNQMKMATKWTWRRRNRKYTPMNEPASPSYWNQKR